MKKILIILPIMAFMLSSCSHLMYSDRYGNVQESARERELRIQEEDFRNLYREIKYLPTDEQRLNLLYTRNIRLFVEQASDILACFSFDSSRLEALRRIVPVIIDRNSIYHLSDVFAFQDARNIALQIISEYESKMTQMNGQDRVRHRKSYHHKKGYDTYYSDAMSQRDFDNFINKVKNEIFDDDKMNLIRIATMNGRFTCDQCVRVMKLYTFDDDKLKVANLFVPCLVDRENAFVILSNFSFGSNKDKFRQMMKDYDSNKENGFFYNVMDPSVFSRFLSSIKNEVFEKDQIKIITLSISSGSYFTASQCKEIMDLFTFDKDKLKICRLIIPKIVDPENAYIVIDNLDFISSKNEAKKLFHIDR